LSYFLIPHFASVGAVGRLPRGVSPNHWNEINVVISLQFCLQKLASDREQLKHQVDVWQQAECDHERMETWLDDMQARLDDAVNSGADVATVCDLLSQYEVRDACLKSRELFSVFFC
jgi:hypothetical protein